MAIVRGKEAVNSIRVSKKLSRPNGYGIAVFGFSFYGHQNEWAGIYQQRQGLSGRINVKEKFYWPTNPQTVPQQANRTKFTSAISAWQILTPTEKQEYNVKARNRHMSGYNLFLREYMLTP